MIVYTHKNVKFEWHGGLFVRLPTDFLPLKLKQCNGVAYWQLGKKVRLSVPQLKKIIKHEKRKKGWR